MLNYNQIKERKYILFHQEPFEVISSDISRKQANKPVNKTKLKSLLSGRVVEHTFHMSDTITEVEVRKKKICYIYHQGDKYCFHDKGIPSARFFVSSEVVKNAKDFMNEKDIVEAIVFDDGEEKETVIGINLPPKIPLTVTEAPPSLKGNTASGGDKLVTLSTGLRITVPLFIKEGDKIMVNTETGKYSERIQKKSEGVSS